jgi:hypothetical protein
MGTKFTKTKFTKTKFPNLSLDVLVATHITLKITHNMSQETSITTPSSDTSVSGSDGLLNSESLPQKHSTIRTISE